MRNTFVIACAIGLAAQIAGGKPATAVAAPRNRPPAAVQHAAAPLGCASLAWTALRGGWWADCMRIETTPRDGEVTIHRYVVFRRHSDGQLAMEDIVETHDSHSIRIKVPRTEKVTLREGRAIYEAHTEPGYSHRRVWDLATTPASLIEDREGGGKVCQDGFSSVSSDVVERTCSTDFAQRRQSCVAEQPDCTRTPVKIEVVRYVQIPVHDPAAPLQVPDLFHCATTIGTHPEDVRSGKNTGRATFQVVAVDDLAANTLALHLRVADRTPQPATKDDWQAHDHWELWLSSEDNELACDDTAKLESYCQQVHASQQMIDVIIAPTADGAWKVLSTSASPPAAWIDELHAHGSRDDLVVELHGAMRDWARAGSITVGYNDSTTGSKRNCQLATSPVQPDRANTLGRLGNTLLCDRSDVARQP